MPLTRSACMTGLVTGAIQLGIELLKDAEFVKQAFGALGVSCSNRVVAIMYAALLCGSATMLPFLKY